MSGEIDARSIERTDEQMAVRDAKAAEICEAFERAQVGARHQRMVAMPYCAVTGYINYGFRGQRQAVVLLRDNGNCSVYLSPIYDLPPGKNGGQIELGPIPLLFTLPMSNLHLGREVVARVRKEVVENADRVEVTIREDRPPIPIASLHSLGDLIDAYEKFYLCIPYSDALISALRRAGKVRHRGRVWDLVFNMVSHANERPHELTLPAASQLPLARILG